MENYKDEIRATRKGCLGSSDGKMLAQIASLGNVPKSAYKRLAVVKGLIEQEDIPENAAIRFGNETEMQIFAMLQSQDEKWQSNVMLVSKQYSRNNVKLISHPDFLKVDEKTKTVYISECKATKYSLEQTRANYAEQLYIHFIAGKEYAKSLGKGWNVKLSLCHYNTEGLDLHVPNEFDTSRLTIRSVRPATCYFDIEQAMDIVDTFLEDFDEFYDGDDVDAAYLPEQVKQQFDIIANTLLEIQAKEQEVNDFKARLYEFMCEKSIKNIKSDLFSITRVDSTESKSFDHKKYLEDFKVEHPRLAKKVVEKYTKTTKRKGYCTIKVKKEEEQK